MRNLWRSQLAIPVSKCTHTHRIHSLCFQFMWTAAPACFFYVSKSVLRKLLCMLFTRWKLHVANMDNYATSTRECFYRSLLHWWTSVFKSRFHTNAPFAVSQEAPALRSRSLSPASSVDLGSGKTREAEQRIRDLEELLQLKVTS